MKYLQRKVDTLVGGLSGLAPLTRGDHALIGRYIQAFNYIELNVWRAVDVLDRAGLTASIDGQGSKPASPRGPFVRLCTGVKRMDPSVEEVEDTIHMLNAIETYRKTRNLLAHWAARRIPGEDAIVLVTKTALDMKQANAVDLQADDGVGTAILDLRDVRYLLNEVNRCDAWMAQKTANWYARYSGK